MLWDQATPGQLVRNKVSNKFNVLPVFIGFSFIKLQQLKNGSSKFLVLASLYDLNTGLCICNLWGMKHRERGPL